MPVACIIIAILRVLINTPVYWNELEDGCLFSQLFNHFIAEKLHQGKCISTAPRGYLHIKNDNSRDRRKGKIVIDPGRAPLIKTI